MMMLDDLNLKMHDVQESSMIEENLAPRDSNTGMKLYLPSPIATANNELCEYDRTRISLKNWKID